MAGYGVGMAVKHIFAAAFGERNFSSDLIDLMVQDGRQGMLLDCFPCDYDLCILPSITDTKLAIHELIFSVCTVLKWNSVLLFYRKEQWQRLLHL